MSSFRMIQISDPHLSRERPLFFFNWELILEWISEARPDLVVCTGDVAFNAISSPGDLAFAREQMDRIDAPWVVVPGNHEVGNNLPDLRGEHTVTSALVGAYRGVFGPDFWSRDVGDWTFIGLNALTLGSGLPEEEEQFAFLREALVQAEGRPIALYMHKPLFLKEPGETKLHQGSLFPEPRAALIEELKGANVKLISTGHNHELVQARWDDIDIAWCPATSFIIVSGAEARGGGERLPGYLDMRFDGSDVEITSILPDELLRIDIGTWLKGGIGLYERFTSSPWPAP